MTAKDPTGMQYEVRSPDGRATALVAQVGASLRGLCVDGVDLVPPYPHDAPTPAASGIVLVPWPNRVRDGAWTQHGTTYQLAISEPAFGNASHGLLRFAAYQPTERSAEAVVLTAHVYPQTGYPFHLEVSVRYTLGDAGLDVTHSVTNVGGAAAPVALGQHPYMCIGDGDQADLVLRSPGSTAYLTDDRKLPTGTTGVDGATDLRDGRRLGDLDLDTAYTDLRRDPDGRARTTLTASDGRSLTQWLGPGFDYVQVFTTDRYPGRALAVAVEPMTAPADALNSGEGLRWLDPGENWTVGWGLEWQL
jgi:aldose 1-epimerase